MAAPSVVGPPHARTPPTPGHEPITSLRRRAPTGSGVRPRDLCRLPTVDDMPLLTTLRRAALGAVALAALVAVTPDPAPVVRPLASTYPTNAAKIFRWGDAQFFDNFISPAKPMWSVNRPRLVRDQHGMLTINATATSGTVSARLTGHNRQYGRWEARVRAEQYTSTGT